MFRRLLLGTQTNKSALLYNFNIQAAMKRYILILWIILTFTGATVAQNATEYRVVRVVGVVENPVSKQTLRTGDVIMSNTKLKFATKDAYIVISSPATGRKKISGVPDDRSRELFDLLQSFLQPERISTASRSVSLAYLESLQASLAYDTLLILSPGYIVINTQKLSLQKPAAIKAWYSHNKKIRYVKTSDDKRLYLDRKSVFGDSIPVRYPKVVVEYFENENEDPVFGPGLLIASFVPIYPNNSDLSTEVRALIGSLPRDASYNQKFAEVRAYLASEYASAQEENLKQWLKEQGILSE